MFEINSNYTFTASAGRRGYERRVKQINPTQKPIIEHAKTSNRKRYAQPYATTLTMTLRMSRLRY